VNCGIKKFQGQGQQWPCFFCELCSSFLIQARTDKASFLIDDPYSPLHYFDMNQIHIFDSETGDRIEF
jgi:hypothetical protein